MPKFLSRRAMTAGLIGVPATALAPPAKAQPEPVEFERYLAFLHHEIRSLLQQYYVDQGIDPPGSPPRHWTELPLLWVPEGFEHPTGPAMSRAADVIAAAKAKPRG